MVDVFSMESEIRPKDKIIACFSDWWSDEEIRRNIIPNTVGKNLKASIDGALSNFENNCEPNKKRFAEILYDLVGQNFLVNQNKEIRNKFLDIILKKKSSDDSTFQDRFRDYLIRETSSPQAGSCSTCGKKWQESEKIYSQKLGSREWHVRCSDRLCALSQQKKRTPKINDPQFTAFLSDFKISKDYKVLCKRLVNEFEFPNEVIYLQRKENRLLPETIKPLNTFSTLYDFQSSIGLKITDMLENYDKETSRAMVVLPTGAGKTRLVVETLIEWINNGKVGKEKSKFVLWIVDKNELCQQTFDTFAEIFRYRGKKDSSLKLHPVYGDSAKNIGDILYQYSEDSDGYGEINEENGIIIASIQSLYRISNLDDQGSLLELGKNISIVIIDEAHHAAPSNKSYNKVLSSLGFNFKNSLKKGFDIHENKACLLGLTATPFRGTDKLGENTKNLLNRFGTKDRILWPPFLANKVVENVPPHAHIDVQKTAYPFERVKLYGERSYDKDGKIKKYRFTIRKLSSDPDNPQKPIVSDETHETENIDVEFEEPGRYQIQLSVIDNDGKASKNTATASIEIYPPEQKEDKTNVEEMRKLYKHLIDREILSVPHHYIIDNTRSIYGTKRDTNQFEMFHDISDRTIRDIGNDSHRNSKIINKVISLVRQENRKSILLFACSIEHSKLLSFMLNAIYDIKSASIDYTVSTDERDQSISDFRRGKISVLCNYDILTTGFDSPKVECVFITRPTYSHLLYNQMTGRGLRGPKSNGTSYCVIVDISDNIQIGGNHDEVEQPWKIFDYIYESTYDERVKAKEDQKCYGCFGNGRKQSGEEIRDCQICNGAGEILKIETTAPAETHPKKTNEERLKEYQKIFEAHPDWNLKKIKKNFAESKKYNAVLESRSNESAPKGDWGTRCRKCGKESSDMPRTLSQFGKSDELILPNNPKGVFDTCKECRDNEVADNKRLESAECPQCRKTAEGYEEVKQQFGFRMMNDKKRVQSRCKKCR